MRNNEAFTGHKQHINKSGKQTLSRRSDQNSRARWLQRNREDSARRKKINPRIVPLENNPDEFFTELILEQQEGGL